MTKVTKIGPASLAEQVYVSGRSITGITSSKPADGMDILFLCLLHVLNVANSATGRTLVQRSLTARVTVCLCVCVCVCVCVCLILCDL